MQMPRDCPPLKHNGGMAQAGWHELRVAVHGRPVFVRRGPDIPGSIPRCTCTASRSPAATCCPPPGRSPTARRRWSPTCRATGNSEAWGHALGIGSLAWALREVLDALGLEWVVLVGNSMGAPVCLEVAHSAPERVAGDCARLTRGRDAQPAPGPGLVQLARDVGRGSPRMAPVVLRDYLHFGPVNALQLFGELVRFPSLQRILRTPVRTLAAIGTRDPLCRRRGGSGRSAGWRRRTRRSR